MKDLVSLKEMLMAGVPGRIIKEALGVGLSEQVTYAHAWGIERRRGRPRKWPAIIHSTKRGRPKKQIAEDGGEQQ
jgi:hypothetical protein